MKNINLSYIIENIPEYIAYTGAGVFLLGLVGLLIYVVHGVWAMLGVFGSILQISIVLVLSGVLILGVALFITMFMAD